MKIQDLINSRISVSKLSMGKTIQSMYNHLQSFDNSLVDVVQLDINTAESFRHYLLNEAIKSNNESISHNSASAYFMAFRNCLKHAYRGGAMEKDLSSMLDGISIQETERYHLNENEIDMLLHSYTDDVNVKRMAYISLTTGMRYSDIIKLTKDSIKNENGINVIKFRQKKTGSLSEIPISDKTRDTIIVMLDENGSLDYCYNKMHYLLKKWFNTAGLPSKKSFFHIFRHTFATMQINKGTDIFTVQDLMGHKSVNTTQIYAKASFSNKVNAIIEL